jgi:hypothetical protein
VSDEQDWRLKVELGESDRGRALDHLIGHLRGPEVTHELKGSVPDDVVLTHDGRLLFAYAANEADLSLTRSAIESVLHSDGLQASIYVSHWDTVLDDWRQTDPPAPASGPQGEEARKGAATVETRTMVASAGKLFRASFEQIMLTWADKLGLQCTIVEHPHLLTTQVGFTVTGPRRKIDEFAQGLKAEGIASIRTEEAAMVAPL